MNRLRAPGAFSLLTYSSSNCFKERVHPSYLANLNLILSKPHLSKTDLTMKILNIRSDVDSIKLNEEQEIIKNLVTDNVENVFYTGAAGTGKSVLLQSIIRELRRKYGMNSVAVTATTGIAAINIGGQTVHSFAGLNHQSKFTGVEKLIEKISRRRKVVMRWKKIKALVIDEISMLDAGLFDKLDHIAQHFRGIKKPFGGLQLIVTGDFCQLPPINQQDREINYCFEANSWWKSLDHTIQLTKVHRQHEQDFVEMLNEFRFGYTSERSEFIISNLNKEPVYENDGIEVTELFPLNRYVDRLNSAKLNDLPHQQIVYEAKDWEPNINGQIRTLARSCLAPPKLKLKIDAQVMLIKNFTPQLVNGSKGIVVGWFSISTMKFYDEAPTDDASCLLPVVKFINGQTKVIPWTEWTLKDELDEVVARRIQIPLILSWAISIHKSQGQTLERVKVDLDRVFEAGQTYVALSRATSLNSLQVLNFSPDKVFAGEKVKEFYNSLTELDSDR